MLQSVIMAAATPRDDDLRGRPPGPRGLSDCLPAVIAAVLLVAPAREARGASFASGPSIGRPEKTTAVALGDVNGDGTLDLVRGNYTEPVTLYLNRGGTFGDTAWSAPVAEVTSSVALGDVDGDGDLDLVVGNYGQAATLYVNSGGGVFGGAVGIGRAEITYGVALGDVDNDGDLDLVRGNYHGYTTLYVNDGHGVFAASPIHIGERAEPTTSVALGDVDNDGDLDLVRGNEAKRSTLYLNAGGTFGDTAWSAPVAEVTSSVALGDVDGDGDLDLVLGNRGQAGTLYRNNGGRFVSWSAIGLPEETRSVALGDVDSDGDLDLVKGNYNQGSTLYLNAYGSGFEGTPDTTFVAQKTQAVALGDVDGDDDLDLVRGNDNQSASLDLNLEPPFAELATQFLPVEKTQAVALGDVDNDGRLDLVQANNRKSIDGGSTLYRNRGGTLASSPDWYGPGPSYCVALGDVDNDGNLDLVLASGLHLNIGGTFDTTAAWPWQAETSTKVALGDVDNDGDLDLVRANGAFQPTRLYRNIGSTFDTTAAWLGPNEGVGGVALGDVDNDGDLDLVYGHIAGLYRNIGGTFEVTPVWWVEENTAAVALGDVNGDGALDLVWMGLSTARLYLNIGGTFALAPWRGPDGIPAARIALGDIDGDGDLDLVCRVPGATQLYFNTGVTFADSAAWTGAQENTTSLALGDMDGDGDLDLVRGNAGDVPTTLYSGASPWLVGGVAARQLPNNAAHLRWVQVGAVAGNRARVTFQAVDVESDPLWVVGEYQLKGRAEWRPMVLDGTPLRAGPFSTSASGVAHTVEWDVTQLPFDHREVVMRLRAVSAPRRAGSIQSVPAYLVEVGKVVPQRPELANLSGSLVYPTLTVGDSARASVEVTNAGNEELVISQVESPDAEVVVMGTPPWRLAPGEGRVVEVVLAPTRELAGLGPVRLHSNDPAHPVTEIALVTDVRTLQFSTSIVAALPELPLGEAVGVLVKPAPAVHVERGYVLYRPGGSGAFADSVALVSRGADFVALIPGAAVTEAGLEYYVRVENSGVYASDPAAGPLAPYYYPVAAPVGMASVARADPSGDYPVGRAIPVEVRLPQGAVFVAGQVYYRAGGSAAEDSVALEVVEVAPGVRVPVGTIPGAAVGPRGVGYRVRVATQTSVLDDPPPGSAVPTRGVRTDVSDVAESASHAGGRYRMVSVPLTLSLAWDATLEALLADDLGAYEPTRWRSFRYLAAEEGYRELSVAGAVDGALRPEAGRAFWLIARETHRIDTAPVAGRSTPTDAGYRIALAPGWNQVGNPYLFAVRWSSVRAESAGVAVTLEPPVRWDEAQGAYDPAEVTVLEPFAGYWVRNHTGGPVELVIAAEEAGAGVASRAQVAAGRGSGGRAVAAAAGDAAADTSGWRVRIGAACGAARDVGNEAGMAAGAQAGRDALDRSEPPVAPGPGLSLYFVADDVAGAGARRTVDVRSPIEGTGDPATQGRRWAFDVARTGGEALPPEVSLSFSGLEGVPGALGVRLVDRVLERAIDLRAEANYTLAGARAGYVTQASEARFELWVGSAEYLAAAARGLAERPRVTRLLPSFPNPVRGWAIVRYETARAGRVTLALYDVAGRRVRTLVDGEREAAVHELVWRGEGEDGRALPAGVYSLRLTTPEHSEVRKLIKLR